MIWSSVISVVLKAGGQRLSHKSSTSGAPGAAASLRSSVPRISIKTANRSMWSHDQICRKLSFFKL